MTKQSDVVVVWPDRGNSFYISLARRVAEALARISSGVELRSASSIAAEQPDSRQGLLLVNPVECALAGETFIANAAKSRRLIAVLAECVETTWYRQQFALGLAYDAVLDVGFTSQERHHPFESTPYEFIFNGPSEDDHFELSATGTRSIPWALIGHRTPQRARLAAELMTTLSPAGFVFLPALRPINPAGRGNLSPGALRAVLLESETYVWCSHHSFPYYESFRFREALMAGSLPCKIDEDVHKPSGIPGTFTSVSELENRLREFGPRQLLHEAVSYYRAQNSFAEHLGRAFERVYE